MTGRLEVSVVDSPAEAQEVAIEEDLRSVPQEVSKGVAIEVIDLCLQPLVQIVEKNVRYLLDPQTASPYIAVTVLKKWAIEAIPDARKEAILDLKHQVLTKINLNSMPLMPKWTEF